MHSNVDIEAIGQVVFVGWNGIEITFVLPLHVLHGDTTLDVLIVAHLVLHLHLLIWVDDSGVNTHNHVLVHVLHRLLVHHLLLPIHFLLHLLLLHLLLHLYLVLVRHLLHLLFRLLNLISGLIWLLFFHLQNNFKLINTS